MGQVDFKTGILTIRIKNLLLKSLSFCFLLIGINLQGLAQNLDWEKNLGGSEDEVANSVIQTSDGGFAIAGESESSGGDVGGNNGSNDYWVVKLDNFGAIEWEKHLGGVGDDQAESIIQTSDDGFAIAGESESSGGDVGGNNGGNDYWVVKLDKKGDVQWEKNFGGSGSDQAYSIIQTSDGGFAITGYSDSYDGDISSNNGGDDYWVVKLNNAGTLQWEQNLGGSDNDFADGIVQTSDGGFVIAGNGSSSDGDVGGNYGSQDYWVVKLDNGGVIQWENYLGGTDYDNCEAITKSSDGGFVVAGYSSSSDFDVGGNNGGNDYWVVKLDNAGVIQWEKQLGGLGDDYARSVVQASDGGFGIAGYSSSSSGDVSGNNGGDDYWVVKLNKAGVFQWEKHLGGTDEDEARSIARTSDGNFLVVGNSNSDDIDVGGNKGFNDYWVAKLGDSQTSSNKTISDNKSELSIYPNPSQNQLRLQNPTEAQTYTLHTLTGQKAQSGKLRGKGTHTLDVSNLTLGVYLLQVQGEDAVRTKKVVVK